ncbi:hypothetical protein [Streptomyces sp. NPDC048436]
MTLHSDVAEMFAGVGILAVDVDDGVADEDARWSNRPRTNASSW